jgi:hypothetical protein
MAKKKPERAQDIRFEDGPLDGEHLRVSLPLPDALKMNMGRDTYVQVEGKQTVFRFDPERSVRPITTDLFGDVG